MRLHSPVHKHPVGAAWFSHPFLDVVLDRPAIV